MANVVSSLCEISERSEESRRWLSGRSGSSSSNDSRFREGEGTSFSDLLIAVEHLRVEFGDANEDERSLSNGLSPIHDEVASVITEGEVTGVTSD